jgi:hypothetical protein
LPRRFEGAAGASCAAADDWSAQRKDSGEEGDVGRSPSRWTCPKDNASCAANAKSAHHHPHRVFDRNQRIRHYAMYFVCIESTLYEGLDLINDEKHGEISRPHLIESSELDGRMPFFISTL